MKASVLIITMACAASTLAQRQMRKHTANEARPVRIVEATEEPPAESHHHFEVQDKNLVITANGIPEHNTGPFPNHGNPHAIEEQKYSFKIPANPQPAKKMTSVYGMPFGVGLNGVVFDPGTAEYWNGDRSSGWNYEALGGAVQLGIDENHAHVQPSGAYHYHGLPTGLMDKQDFTDGEHSPLIGWAADGYPIYALYGHDGKDASKVIRHTSSYRLKDGDRPDQPEAPGGAYDGAFVQDFEYVPGFGTLDECNGTWTVTPEFPDGTYAYFLTEEWPVIPRAFRGTPVNFKGNRGHSHRRPRR
ncbi:YHYH protein [Pontiellaceae bacterium B12227]|nr:YHYH protein [Pontiellaceae bacterium B12227]